MKKLLLVLSVFVVTFSAFAAELNPFAYGLKSSVNATNPMRLDIEYKLNAPATSVKVYLYDVNKTWEQEVTVQELLSKKLNDHRTAYSYTGWIDLSVIPGHLRGGENNILWRVDVTGKAVDAMTFVDYSVKLFAPTSVDVDNNPENANFGTVFCIEGLDDAYYQEGYENYISYYDGAGLYVLNADGTARKMPYQTSVRYGYNGGVLADHDAERQYFLDGNKNTGAYSPYRVRVADDGRIFITSLTPPRKINNVEVLQVLWEANKVCFSANTKEEWKANTGWNKVISSSNDNTNVQLTKSDKSSFTYGNIYNLYTNDGKYIAAPNIGFDVRGGKEKLQLLMLSANKQSIVLNTDSYYNCNEYNLGTASVYNRAADKHVFDGHVVFYTDPQVEYDKDGNVWLAHHRSSSTIETLIRYNKSGGIDYSDKLGYLRSGAIRFNKDYTKLALATKGTGSGGAVTIYPVKEDGWPDFTKGVQVSTLDKTSHTLTDFAWDYADNLYIASKNKNGTAGECIAVYATKRTADEVVSTPAASGFAFEVNCASDESYLINVTAADNQGSATITAGFDAEGKVPACTPVEVFAQSKDDYKFVCWKEGDVEVSRENPYTFLAVKDVTLTAHFEKGDYTVTWWNLFKNGEDIGKESTAYPGTNERLWRLYQIEYEKYNTSKSGASMRWHYDTHKPDGVSKAQFNVGTFVYYNTRGDYNRDFLTSSTTNTTTPFAWLGKYIESVTGTVSTNIPHWQYVIYLFFNRTNKAYNASEVDCTSNVTWTDNTKSFAKDYGMPEYWRPWWTEAVCNLEKTISSEKSMPVTWNQDITCAAGDVAKFGKFNGTAPTSNKETQPSLWYQWNTAPKSDQLLAWRDGGTTGRIVHHVYRDNMKLYATYVDAHLQENDPQPDLSKNPYDATNNDVLDLLANNNHASTPLNFTIDRKFVGGMYNTVCFPFDLPLSKLPEGLKDADIRVFNGATESNEFGESVVVLNFITLQEYWQNETAEGNPPYLKEPYLQAGVPYLIKPIADVDADLAFSNFDQVLIWDGTQTPGNEIFGDVTFQGVFNPTDLPENAYILVANNRLAKVTDGSEMMKGFRGYFTWNDPVRMPPAKMSISIGKQTPTAIEEITDPQPTEQPATSKVRKVMYNGQIYILRGEEVYTITGHRVK